MTSFIRSACVALFILFVATPVATSFAQNENGDSTYVTLPVNVSLVPGLSVGDAVARATGAKIVNNVAWSLLAGRAARLEGVEWAGLASVYREDIRGAQFSGLANLVGGAARGAQFSGLLNIVGGSGQVAQFAGVMNLVGEDALGIQSAGAINIVAEEFGGAQFAGAVNIVGGDLSGAQFAGGANVVGGVNRGVQIGIANVATGVTGVQIGVVNMAERHHGVPIGLVSYVKEEGLRYDGWADESGMISASVRSGNRLFSNHAGFALRAFGEDTYMGLLGGVGVEVPLYEEAARFGIDFLSYGLWNDDLENNWMTVAKMRAIVGVAVARHLEFFAGGTFNVLVADQADSDVEFAPWSVYEHTSDDVFVQMWPGFVGGIRIR